MNELDKLREMLRNANIPFEDYQEEKPFYDKGSMIRSIMMYGQAGKYTRNQIVYGRIKKEDSLNIGDEYWKFDAVCQHGSDGAKEGMIETYGELGVGSDGEPRVMTAEQAFEIIKNDWEKEKKQ